MSENKPKDGPEQVGWITLVALMLSAILGSLAVLLFQNIIGEEAIQFSTIELITFLFSIVLAGASIVLAVSAILLGKMSEKAIMERSDVSLKLQTEIFAKTNDALSEIKASTGVTERRIEDIISGNLGPLAEDIADDLASSGARVRGMPEHDLTELRESIEKSIRESLFEQLHAAPNSRQATRTAEMDERLARARRDREKRQQERKKYEEWHSNFEGALKENTSFDVLTTGHGDVGKSKFFDIVATQAEKKLGISTARFDTKPSVQDNQKAFVKIFVERSVGLLATGKFDLVVLILALKDSTKFDLESYRELKKSISGEFDDKILIAATDMNEPIAFANGTSWLTPPD